MKLNEENSQKAQKLTKEELEQVNGGYQPDLPKGYPYNRHNFEELKR